MPGSSIEGASWAVARAPYSRRPPSPPSIPIHVTFRKGIDSPYMLPSCDNLNSMRLTIDDLNIITRNVQQTATDRSVNWKYEARHKAQSILDFLYLGPLHVARDSDWLANEGITMIIVARHPRIAQARLMSKNSVAKQLGIKVEYVDVSENGELIKIFPEVVRKINDHLLEVYRSQVSSTQQGQPAIDAGNFTPGKVLIVCETGNERSPHIAAAYIMTVYGRDAISSIQFVSAQRFSANFDEDGKRMLLAYEEILTAEKNVSSAKIHVSGCGQFRGRAGKGKRGIEATFDDEDKQEGAGCEAFITDRARYENREKFVPFVDAEQT